jgi:hypothetical protein
MRHVSAKALGLIGGTGAAVVAAVLVLVLASGGAAAGKNICAVPSAGSPPSAASCVKEQVAPGFLSTGGGSALSVTKFTNEAAGTTAAHVVLAVNFPSPKSVASIGLAINGSSADASACTPAPSSLPATVSTVSCPVGNIAGGGTAKMTVRFTTTTTATLTGSATYGEGGGTPGQPPNSVQVNTGTVTVSSDASVQGGCFNGPTTTVTGTTTGQATSATVGTAADNSLPCTFVDAGVLDNSFAAPGTLKSQISFVDFPALGGATGFATVKIFFTPLPAGVSSVNKLKLLEDTNYGVPFFKTYITVPGCDRSGNIPAPVGIPAKGATDASAHSNDSCIFNRSPLQGGGGELDLHAISSPFDSHFGT